MTSNRDNIIIDMYKQGKSSNQIYEECNCGVSVRQIQRIIKLSGIMRSQSESYRLAIKVGRMKYKRLPKELLKQRKGIPIILRYKVMSKYGFKCCKCGATAKDDKIEIDHKDDNPSNNNINNLQVLCSSCNRGKHYMR